MSIGHRKKISSRCRVPVCLVGEFFQTKCIQVNEDLWNINESLISEPKINLNSRHKILRVD